MKKTPENFLSHGKSLIIFDIISQNIRKKHSVINEQVYFWNFLLYVLSASGPCLIFTNAFFFFLVLIKREHNEHTTSVQWFIFHTSSNKTSCENSCRCNPYHWSRKAKPELPAHWVFDVSAVSSCRWNASPPACRAEESPAPLKAAHNRLSTLVMLSLLPVRSCLSLDLLG